MTKLLSSVGFIISVIITAACSNSSPVSNFKAPPKFEPVDKPIMVDREGSLRIGAVRLSSANEASIEILNESNIDQYVYVNSDESLQEPDEDDDSSNTQATADSRESGLPEYIVFTKIGNPFDIFIYDYVHGIVTAVFDLQSEELLDSRSDERICGLSEIPRIDPETLGDELIYSYNSVGVYLTAAKDCASEWSNRNFYELEFITDEDSGTLIELPSEDQQEGSQANIVKVPDLSAKRKFAPEALASGGIIITSSGETSETLQYGILGYSYQQQALEFYLPVQADSTIVEFVWSVPLAAKQTPDGKALLPDYMLTSSNYDEPIVIQYADELYRLDKKIIFDPGLQAARLASFAAPYAMLDDPSNPLELSFIESENTIYFRDGNFIKSVNEFGTVSTEKNIIDDFNAINFSFTREEDGFTIYKHLNSDLKVVTSISSANVENTLEAAGTIPRFDSDARLYEYIKLDSQGDFTRTVQSFLNGVNNGSGIENSTFTTAVDYRKSYPGNLPLQTALFSGDITSKNDNGLIKDGALFIYDTLGVTTDRSFLGRVNTDIREITSVNLVTETYGILTADTDDGVSNFYFNPRLARNNDDYTMQGL
jgi:hypothetical protein